MSLLVKRHQWSKSPEKILSIDNNQSELSQNPVRHLFLIRHGQYQRYRTQSDGYLTTKGKKQAWYAANFLISQLPSNVLFDSLTHSDSTKTKIKNKRI
jgi:hypothetical protein